MEKIEYRLEGRKVLIEKANKGRKAGTYPRNRNWRRFTILLLIEIDENGKILGFFPCREKAFKKKAEATGRVLVYDAKAGGYRTK